MCSLDSKYSRVFNHLLFCFCFFFICYAHDGDGLNKVPRFPPLFCVLFGSVYSQSFLYSCSSNQQVSWR